MRRNIPTIFAILLLGILVLCSACTGPGTEVPQQNTSESSKQTGGLVQVTVPSSGPARIGFDAALQKLNEYQTGTFNQKPADFGKIYFILARDVDDQGNATSWVFGLNNGSESWLLIFDRTGRTEMPLSKSSLPTGEIVLDRTVPPGKVFSENKEAILGSPVSSVSQQRELELKEGIYTLTITSAKTVRVIRFNAATGALMV